MPSKPMALPTTKKKLRDEADETMRNSILILVEMKDENSKKALTYFSKLKNLPQKLFLQIYKITNEKVL
jgi:hypothetical protein